MDCNDTYPSHKAINIVESDTKNKLITHVYRGHTLNNTKVNTVKLRKIDANPISQKKD